MICDSFSLKREVKLYIVYSGLRYNIDISEINFSQTLRETSYPVKSLQAQNMFEGSVINTANPANFSFTMPAIREDDLRVVFDRLLDYQSFSIIVETQQDVFQLDIAVITDGSFVIERTRPLSLTVSGEASQLTRLGDPGVTLPGTPVARDLNRTYNRVSDLSIQLNSQDISTLITTVNININNNIRWTPWTTVDGAVEGNIMYPTAYTVTNRELSGSLVQYLADENDTFFQDWNTDVPLNIQAGQVSGSFYGFTFNLTNCAFRTTIGTGQVFTQTYNWRSTQNPANLSDIVTYTNT